MGVKRYEVTDLSETVRLGEVTLTRIATPGHTPGNSSWALTVRDPGIVADFRRSFARLARVHADVVLPAHSEVADVLGRERTAFDAELGKQEGAGLLPTLVAQARTAFEAELAKQQGAGR